MAVYPLIRVFVTVLKPVNWLFTKWKQFLSRLLRMDDDHAITQDELLTLVEEAKQEGGMNADESELLKSAIEFHDLDVSDILTPRVRVDGVPLESTPQGNGGAVLKPPAIRACPSTRIRWTTSWASFTRRIFITVCATAATLRSPAS